jgi:rfaE bifunctional protein nucleotidyltransferase chain/domain/rfaE bifunctional protein kinase chain/domain
MNPRVVVIGDVVLDRDIVGRTERIAPDAPVPIVDVDEVRESPGGAGLAALLCAGTGVDVVLVAPVASDPAGRRLAEMLRCEVDLVSVPHEGSTRRKTRVRSAGQSLVRLDSGGPGFPVEPPLQAVRDVLDSADVVLVSDYGAGVTLEPGLRRLLTEAAQRSTLVWDPHPRGGSPVPGVALATPNLAEATAVLGSDRGRDHCDTLAAELRRSWQARAVAVTAGSRGAFLAMAGTEPLFVPAPTVPQGDPCGAGDRFVATAAVALARGAVLSEAVVDAVAEASAWVAAGGVAAFRDGLSDPESSDGFVRSGGREGRPGSVEEVVARVRARGGTLVATGGCFDILHAGHVASLDAARRLGDALVVLVNSDQSVRRLKGPDRPAVTAADRVRVLEALSSVDAVAVFDEDDPRAVLDRLRPDVWAKGGDYGAEALPEADLVRGWGGRVVLLPYVDGRSTTSILQRSAARSASLQEVR